MPKSRSPCPIFGEIWVNLCEKWPFFWHFLHILVAQTQSYNDTSFFYSDYDLYRKSLLGCRKVGHHDLFLVKYWQICMKNDPFLALFTYFGGTFLQYMAHYFLVWLL